jgi:hypothetical protein
LVHIVVCDSSTFSLHHKQKSSSSVALFQSPLRSAARSASPWHRRLHSAKNSYRRKSHRLPCVAPLSVRSAYSLAKVSTSGNRQRHRPCYARRVGAHVADRAGVPRAAASCPQGDGPGAHVQSKVRRFAWFAWCLCNISLGMHRNACHVLPMCTCAAVHPERSVRESNNSDPRPTLLARSRAWSLLTSVSSGVLACYFVAGALLGRCSVESSSGPPHRLALQRLESLCADVLVRGGAQRLHGSPTELGLGVRLQLLRSWVSRSPYDPNKAAREHMSVVRRWFAILHASLSSTARSPES